MNARYANPWYSRKSGGPGPEIYESSSEPMSHAGCVIYLRHEFGYPVYDVVLDGLCVAQRGSLAAAKTAAETKPWIERKWWKERLLKEAAASEV